MDSVGGDSAKVYCCSNTARSEAKKLALFDVVCYLLINGGVVLNLLKLILTLFNCSGSLSTGFDICIVVNGGRSTPRGILSKHH